MSTTTGRIGRRLTSAMGKNNIYHPEDVAAYIILNRSEFIAGFTLNMRLRFEAWRQSIETN